MSDTARSKLEEAFNWLVNNILYIALVAALVAQIPHTLAVFYRLAPPGNNWLNGIMALLYAVALELAILLFVTRGRKAIGGAFALTSIAVNLVYYLGFGAKVESSTLAAVLLSSVSLPVAIGLYSHEVTRHQQADKQGRGFWWYVFTLVAMLTGRDNPLNAPVNEVVKPQLVDGKPLDRFPAWLQKADKSVRIEWLVANVEHTTAQEWAGAIGKTRQAALEDLKQARFSPNGKGWVRSGQD